MTSKTYDPFPRMIREVKRVINEIMFFEVLVNSLLIFLVLFIILYGLMLYPQLAFIPAGLYLLIEMIRKLSINKILLVERNFPELNEKFRTSVDLNDENNPVLKLLQLEVLRDMKKVFVSKFFNPHNTFSKVIVVAGLCFLVIVMASFNLRVNSIDMLQDAIKNSPIKFKSSDDDNNPYSLISNFNDNFVSYEGTEQDYGDSDIGLQSNKVNEDIFGGKSIATLGDKTLNIDIAPVSFEVNIQDVDDKSGSIKYDTFNYESSVYEDPVGEKTKEQQELIKKYFKKLGET